jgi:hypothetical protein
MSKHSQNGRAAHSEGDERTESSLESSPVDELDWRGVLERVREEFRVGRAQDGVRRTFH